MTVMREDHEHAHTHSGGRIAAWVGEHAITIDEVLRRETALREGEFASRLPVRRTPQGRNVVRWIVQLVATEQLISAEAAARGLGPGSGERRPVLDITTALELGGVLATVLASMPVAAAVRDHVTADVQPDPAEVRRYYENNPDQFEVPESRVIDTTRISPAPAPALPPALAPAPAVALAPARSTVRRGELPPSWESVVFTAGIGVPVRVTPGQVVTVREIRPLSRESFADAAPRIAADLREHERDLRFADWVHRGHRALVRLAPGYEHPGDPHHPDATHHH